MQTQTIKIGTQVTSAKLGKGIVTTILSKQKNYYEIRFGLSYIWGMRKSFKRAIF